MTIVQLCFPKKFERVVVLSFVSKVVVEGRQRIFIEIIMLQLTEGVFIASALPALNRLAKRRSERRKQSVGNNTVRMALSHANVRAQPDTWRANEERRYRDPACVDRFLS